MYQIILSKSNGGKEAVTSTYNSFLKGDLSGSVDKEDVEGSSIEEDHLDVRMTMMLKEQEQIPKKEIDEISPIKIQTDPLPKEMEVKFQEDIFQVGKKDNVDAAGTELSPYIFDSRHQMFHNYF